MSAAKAFSGSVVTRSSGNDVVAAAKGVDVIVHAVNPPGYRKWSEVVLPMLDNTIAAAAACEGYGGAPRHHL